MSEHTEVLKLAKQRIDFDESNIRFDYQGDVDLLVTRFSDEKVVNSKMDYDNDVVRNFDKNGDIVFLEILDLYGVFATN